ncbi:MAG TPA: hypothetical protein VGS61_02310 [Acidimicrobiales bacterium]|nr:hypothetical protein [Acidimicrobiales bacterium]
MTAASAVALVSSLAPALAGLPASATGKSYFLIATFTGDGYVSAHSGGQSSDTSVAWWAEDSVHVDNSGSAPVIELAYQIKSTVGYGGLKRKAVQSTCSAAYELLEQLHPTQNTSAGIAFYTAQDHGAFLNPGPDGVVVAALPFWADYVRISPTYPDCSATSASDLESLIAAWGDKSAQCVVSVAKEGCADTLRVRGPLPGSSGTYAGYAQISVKRSLDPDITLPLPPIHWALIPMIQLLFPPDLPTILMKTFPPPIPRLPTINIPKTDDGELQGQIYIAKQPIVTTKARVTHGGAVSLPLAWNAAGLTALRAITAATPVTVTVTFTPVTGAPYSQSVTVYVLPGAAGGSTTPPPTPTISSVAFTGSPANPTVTIHGTNLGARPSPSPSGHPAGLNGCPTVAGDVGYDYGTSLYIAVPSKNWSGGRYRPSLNETDCIDLVVTTFTSTEVVFHFGTFYTSQYPKFSLSSGTPVEVGVNGATLPATVSYG